MCYVPNKKQCTFAVNDLICQSKMFLCCLQPRDIPMKKLFIATMIATLLSACAYQQKPVVDMTNVDQAQYEQDFSYCQSYAESVDKAESAKVNAQNGAASGAVVGGAVVGGLEDGLAGVAVGALAGGGLSAGGSGCGIRCK